MVSGANGQATLELNGSASDAARAEVLLMQTMSLLSSRLNYDGAFGTTFGGKRDVYKALGYKLEPQVEDYWLKFERQDIASRIVTAPAAATWRKVPKIVEKGKPKPKPGEEVKETEFEEAWEELERELGVFSMLERLDIISGIGEYGILLVGFAGVTDFRRPRPMGQAGRKLLYLSAFSQRNVEVSTWDTDPKSPRFGKPKEYLVDFGRGANDRGFTNAGAMTVHHSHVLHVAEGLLEDDVIGTPRLQKVYNRLDDLEKIAGGSAEMFWQGAFPGVHANVQKDMQWDAKSEAAKAAIEQIENYVHQLQRWVRTQGIEINTLTPAVASPREHFDTIIDLIAGATGIPQRILMGAERGELASKQDDANWNARVMERQTSFAGPRILEPFVKLCIDTGALPEPPQGFEIDWPDLLAPSPTDKADTASKWATAISTYAGISGGEMVVPFEEFREKYLELDPVPEGGFPKEEPIDETDPQVKDQAGKMKDTQRGGRAQGR